MERKYAWKMKEAEKLSFGEKVPLPPQLLLLTLKSSFH